MNDFLFSVNPCRVFDYMGVDFFDSSDVGCMHEAAQIRAAEEAEPMNREIDTKLQQKTKGGEFTNEKQRQKAHGYADIGRHGDGNTLWVGKGDRRRSV